MGVKSTIRRLLYGNTTGDKLDNTPIELPVGHHKLPSAARELQEQIAIQIALKQASEGADNLQTIGEIEAELEALDGRCRFICRLICCYWRRPDSISSRLGTTTLYGRSGKVRV